jgi:hypothetical protein
MNFVHPVSVGVPAPTKGAPRPFVDPQCAVRPYAATGSAAVRAAVGRSSETTAPTSEVAASIHRAVCSLHAMLARLREDFARLSEPTLAAS